MFQLIFWHKSNPIQNTTFSSLRFSCILKQPLHLPVWCHHRLCTDWLTALGHSHLPWKSHPHRRSDDRPLWVCMFALYKQYAHIWLQSKDAWLQGIARPPCSSKRLKWVICVASVLTGDPPPPPPRAPRPSEITAEPAESWQSLTYFFYTGELPLSLLEWNHAGLDWQRTKQFSAAPIWSLNPEPGGKTGG